MDPSIEGGITANNQLYHVGDALTGAMLGSILVIPTEVDPMVMAIAAAAEIKIPLLRGRQITLARVLEFATNGMVAAANWINQIRY